MSFIGVGGSGRGEGGRRGSVWGGRRGEGGEEEGRLWGSTSGDTQTPTEGGRAGEGVSGIGMGGKGEGESAVKKGGGAFGEGRWAVGGRGLIESLWEFYFRRSTNSNRGWPNWRRGKIEGGGRKGGRGKE